MAARFKAQPDASLQANCLLKVGEADSQTQRLRPTPDGCMVQRRFSITPLEIESNLVEFVGFGTEKSLHGAFE